MKAIVIIYKGELISKSEITSAIQGFLPDRNVVNIINNSGEFSSPVELDYDEEDDDVVEDNTPEIKLVARYRVPAYYNDDSLEYYNLNAAERGAFGFIAKMAGDYDDLDNFLNGQISFEELLRADDLEPSFPQNIRLLLDEFYQQVRRAVGLPLYIEVSVYSDRTISSDTTGEDLMFGFGLNILTNEEICSRINMAEPVGAVEEALDTAQAVREVVMASPSAKTMWADLDTRAQSEFRTLAAQHNVSINVNNYECVEQALSTLRDTDMYNSAVQIYNSWVTRR